MKLETWGKRLRAAVAKAVAASYEDLRRAHRGERFYTYALYTEPLLASVLAAGNTEEAMARWERHHGLRAPDLETRWNPEDWECYDYEVGRRRFGPVGKLLERYDSMDEKQFVVVREAYLGALADADAAGVFGSGTEREGIVINLLWGDQDGAEFVRTAKRLNPKRAAARYQRDMKKIGWL